MKSVASDGKNGQFRRASLSMLKNTEHIEQTVHMNTKHVFIKNTHLLSARYLLVTHRSTAAVC